MYLIELFLPLADNNNQAFESEYFEEVQQHLTEKFGGLTAFTRNPAEGLWKQGKSSKVHHDNIIIFEVFASTLDKPWWKRYKEELKTTFQQKDLIIKVVKIELI